MDSESNREELQVLQDAKAIHQASLAHHHVPEHLPAGAGKVQRGGRGRGAIRSKRDPRHYVSEHIFHEERLAGASHSPFVGKEIPHEFYCFDKNGFGPYHLAGNNLYNQGPTDKCVAYVGCTMREWQVYTTADRSGHPLSKITFSKDYLYDLRENSYSEGMSGIDLMRIIVKYGCITEDAYHQYLNLYQELLSLERRRQSVSSDHELDDIDNRIGRLQQSLNALIYRLPTSHTGDVYAEVKTVHGLKEAIVYNGPCLIITPFYDKSDPQFWVPSHGSAKAHEDDELGHAVTVVGYSDKEQAFLLRNTWGPKWNGNGHVWFPYAEINKGNFWEIWTIFFQGQQHLAFHRRIMHSRGNYSNRHGHAPAPAITLSAVAPTTTVPPETLKEPSATPAAIVTTATKAADEVEASVKQMKSDSVQKPKSSSSSTQSSTPTRRAKHRDNLPNKSKKSKNTKKSSNDNRSSSSNASSTLTSTSTSAAPSKQRGKPKSKPTPKPKKVKQQTKTSPSSSSAPSKPKAKPKPKSQRKLKVKKVQEVKKTQGSNSSSSSLSSSSKVQVRKKSTNTTLHSKKQRDRASQTVSKTSKPRRKTTTKTHARKNSSRSSSSIQYTKRTKRRMSSTASFSSSSSSSNSSSYLTVSDSSVSSNSTSCSSSHASESTPPVLTRSRSASGHGPQPPSRSSSFSASSSSSSGSRSCSCASHKHRYASRAGRSRRRARPSELLLALFDRMANICMHL